MDRHEWPAELWIARVTDCPSWFVSVCDTPRQPDDKRYVLADWIFVDDRLPDGYEAVLIAQRWAETVHVSIAEYRPEHHEWWKRGLAGYRITSKDVLAWQPLPPPPTAEQIASYRTRTEGAPCYDD